jgi:hypothetical protein
MTKAARTKAKKLLVAELRKAHHRLLNGQEPERQRTNILNGLILAHEIDLGIATFAPPTK